MPAPASRPVCLIHRYRAVSTGGSSTSILIFLQLIVHGLCGCLAAERFSRSADQRSRDSLKITGPMLAEICAHREVLPHFEDRNETGAGPECLERFEEASDRRMVLTVALATLRHVEPMLAQKLLVVVGAVLRPVIGVMTQGGGVGGSPLNGPQSGMISQTFWESYCVH